MKTLNDPVTMGELMRILKPKSTVNFMDMCAGYVKEINEYDYSQGCYEISGLDTKAGNPVTFEN